MSSNFSSKEMRIRGFASLALIALIGSLFVTQFNSKNTDVAQLALVSNSLEAMNSKIVKVVSVANHLRTEKDKYTQSAQINHILELGPKLDRVINNFDKATQKLSKGIRNEVRLSAGFTAEHLWPERRILTRIEELSIVNKIVESTGGNNRIGGTYYKDYYGIKGFKYEISPSQPYAMPALRIAGPQKTIIPTGRHKQQRKINALQLEASKDLKWMTLAFVGAGLTVLCFIALFIFWPLEKIVSRQIKELENSQQKVEMADRAKSEFLANMSHEIRTPMNGVMGMAELLANTELDAKQRTFTDIIVKSGSSLLIIINDILDFSKIDAGQMELDSAPFDLAEAIEDVATLVSSRVAEKDIELIVRVDPSLPKSFIGDVGRIRQIVTNLMGNAVKFTDKGHVYVDVIGEALEGEIVDQGNSVYNLKIKVEDTGVGIPPEKCDKVFEKFSQVDTSATRKHEGTGLGLAISSSLVKMMGGEINVESELGVGSTFWFALKLPVHISDEDNIKVDVDVSGSRILIVDDNPVNRSILSEQMNAWKFENVAAVDGDEALAFMRAAKQQDMNIDAIVLDYHMPGMNGVDVVRTMQQDPLIADIPVVMLTSVEFTKEGNTFSSLGVQGHLTKPARSSLLLETIIDVICKNRKHNTTPTKDKPSFAALIAEAAMQPFALPKMKNSMNEVSQAPVVKNDFDRDVNIEDSDLQILVCEDNDVNKIVFTQTLQSGKFNFKVASNGEIGVDYYKKFQPKIILMDVSMPKMNGLDATKTIRELEAGTDRHVIIIGVTAHAINGDKERCLEAGMDDYLPKPISPEALLKKITTHLSNIEAAALNDISKTA